MENKIVEEINFLDIQRTINQAFEKLFQVPNVGGMAKAVEAIVNHALEQDEVIINQKKEKDELKAENEILTDRIHKLKNKLMKKGYGCSVLNDTVSINEKKQVKAANKFADNLRQEVVYYHDQLIKNEGENILNYPKRLHDYALSMKNEASDLRVRVDELELELTNAKHADKDLKEEIERLSSNYSNLLDLDICLLNSSKDNKYYYLVSGIFNAAKRIKEDLNLLRSSIVSSFHRYDEVVSSGGFSRVEARNIPDMLADKAIHWNKLYNDSLAKQKAVTSNYTEDLEAYQAIRNKIVEAYNYVFETKDHAGHIAPERYLYMVEKLLEQVFYLEDQLRKSKASVKRLKNTLFDSVESLKLIWKHHSPNDELPSFGEVAKSTIQKMETLSNQVKLTMKTAKEANETSEELDTVKSVLKHVRNENNALRRKEQENCLERGEHLFMQEEYKNLLAENKSLEELLKSRNAEGLWYRNWYAVTEDLDIQKAEFKKLKKDFDKAVETAWRLLSYKELGVIGWKEMYKKTHRREMILDQAIAQMLTNNKEISDRKDKLAEKNKKLKEDFDLVVFNGYEAMRSLNRFQKKIETIHQNLFNSDTSIIPYNWMIDQVSSRAIKLNSMIRQYEKDDTSNLAERYEQAKTLCARRGQELHTMNRKYNTRGETIDTIKRVIDDNFCELFSDYNQSITILNKIDIFSSALMVSRQRVRDLESKIKGMNKRLEYYRILR